jgi:hypothetical protein
MGDTDDFFDRIGKDVPIYRDCQDCRDLCIVNPDNYDKPKTPCDPGYCEKLNPFCICKDRVLYKMRDLEQCDYPNCDRRAPDVVPDDDDDYFDDECEPDEC